MTDDWRDRWQDTNDYLNRHDDRVDVEKTQVEKAKAVHKAILNKDDMRIRYELGIPPSDPSEVGEDSLGDSGEESRAAAEPLDEMIDGQREILDAISECERRGLPVRLGTAWSNRLNNIYPTDPEAEAVLKALEMEVKSYHDEYPWDFCKIEDEDAQSLELLLFSIESGLYELSMRSSLYRSCLHSQKSQPAAEPIAEVKPLLREDIEALANSSSLENVTRCPICNVKMKAKNLVIHFDKQHWWKEKGTF